MADYSQMSDSELLANNTADSEKIAELISRYMKAVWNAAGKYSGTADREELVSDGIQGLMSAIRTYNSEKGEFSAYLAVCLDNTLKNTAKRALRRKSRLSDLEPEAFEAIADERLTPEEAVIEQESRADIFRNMRTNLTELEFRCMEGVILGMSYAEIADELKADKKTVDNALSRARTKLRRFYAEKRRRTNDADNA